ncbi:MAG: NAD-dependent epimerase/dehydratase family protein [Anaerolineales bacterium]
MMKILVTGGAGFIGSHLVSTLAENGHQVRVLDALVEQVHGKNGAQKLHLPESVEFVRGDVRNIETWRESLRGCQAVYHLAAEVGVGQSMYEIVKYMSANTMGTSNLLQLLTSERGEVQKLVVASSMSIYGEGAYECTHCGAVVPEVRSTQQLQQRQWELSCPSCGQALVPIPTSEEKPLQPTSVYAISKRDQEELCLSVGRAYDIPSVALRFFNVFGPGQAMSNPYTGVVAIFGSRLLNHKAPLIFEDGLQSRDFVHVSDIVQALLLALECETADYQAFNIGSGQPRTVNEVAQALAKALEVDITPQIVGQYREGDIRHCFADISKARELL